MIFVPPRQLILPHVSVPQVSLPNILKLPLGFSEAAERLARIIIQRPTTRQIFIGNPAVTVSEGKKQTAATVYLWDTFAGANGSSISGRTPDTVANGAEVWVADSDVASIQNNRAKGSFGDSTYHYDVGHGDYTLTYTFKAIPDYVDIQFRYSDNSNRWLFRMYASASVVQLYKVEAGNVTLPASASQTFAPNVDHTGTIILNGTSISCQVNNGTPLLVTDGFNQSLSLVQFHINEAGEFDDFKVVA